MSIILFTQVYYTYKHFGGSLGAWKTPMHTLLDNGAPASDRGITATGGLGGATSTGATTFPAASSHSHAPVPMMQTTPDQQQQPMAATKVETSAV